jgi:hypothetical protein
MMELLNSILYYLIMFFDINTTTDLVVYSVFAVATLIIAAMLMAVFLRVFWSGIWGAIKKQPQAVKNISRRTTKKKPPSGNIHLSELAKIWLENGEVHLSELAPIWCDKLVNKIETSRTRLDFDHPRIQEFYIDHVLSLCGEHRDVVEELLKMLDSEGDCPSVVNVMTDIEVSLNSSTYELLGQTTLLDHTLNVAEDGIRLLDKNTQFLLPDIIIATLAHDIGKLPSIKTYLYALGEHPLTACKVLIEIESFNRLARKDAILKAVTHHHKKPEEFLGQTLRRADQMAREMEFQLLLLKLPPLEEQRPAGYELPSLAPLMDEVEKPKPAKNDDLYKAVTLPWFNLEAMIEELRPHINQLQDRRRFTAFSMSNGYVYVQPNLIEKIAKKQAEQAGVLDVVSKDEKNMPEVLVSIIKSLRQEEMLAGEFVKPGYFGTYFNINFRSGYVMKGYYVPFHAEVFGSIGEMEKLKTGMLLEFASVELFNEKGEENAK